MDNKHWAKLLVQSVYTVWFLILDMKIKNDFDDCFRGLINYAISKLYELNELKIRPNEIIYRCLVEICGFYEANESL